MGKSVLAKFVAGHVVFDFGYDFLHYESPPGFLFTIMYFFIVMVLTIFSVCRNFCRSILIKLFSFSTIVKMVLQTDFFRNNFRRTNNLFGPPCATFLKTKGKGYGDISIATATGGGITCRPVAGKYRGGVGRENEIATCEIFNKP